MALELLPWAQKTLGEKKHVLYATSNNAGDYFTEKNTVFDQDEEK